MRLFSIICLLALISCDKETLAPEVFGDIQGRVIDSITEEGISGVSITTSPPTDAILTDADGTFFIQTIPEGNYTISAKKPDYSSNNVSISVRNDRPTSATIFLEQNDEDDLLEISSVLAVKINRFESTISNDSNFVSVEYEIENISRNTNIAEYEVYFTVFAGNQTYKQSQSGEDLDPGKKFFGSFNRYTFRTAADSVIVDDVWAPGFQ